MNSTNISNEKENQNSKRSNDNSYIFLEDILYYSSPKRGIKSKSNSDNKQYNFTPFTSNTDMHNTLCTFNIIKEASTDICSKEEPLNSQKASNIISDFSISYLKNSNIINSDDKKDNATTFIEKGEKEKEKLVDINNIKEEEEFGMETKKKKGRQKDSKNKKLINKFYSSNLEENKNDNNIEMNTKQRNAYRQFNENKNKEKKLKRKNIKHQSIDIAVQKKLTHHIKDRVKRYSSVNFIENIHVVSEKKKIKNHFYEDEYLNMNNKKNIIEERNKFKNKHHKNKKLGSKKEEKIKFSKSLKNTELKNGIIKKNSSDGLKISKKKRKKNNPPNTDYKDNNFEDKNFISHPIKFTKEESLNINNMFTVKSSRFISQKHFFLIKEMDRDYETNEKINKEIRSAKKIIKHSKKRATKSKKNLFDKQDGLFNSKSKEKEISEFFDFKEENKKSKKEFKNKYSLPLFRKSNHNNNEKVNDNDIYKSKKSSQFYNQFEKTKEKRKEYKLKSSITLKKCLNKKDSDIKENTNKNQRRHTIYSTKENKKDEVSNEIKNEKKNNSSFYSEDFSDKGYDNDCSSLSDDTIKDKLRNDKKTRMEIGGITEDKLILNYQDKKEIIEVLSDKENIDNYYEFLGFCLETIQDLNLKEVPKSKTKINFKFSKERQNKKIALFDLDETLVHCIGDINKNNCDNPKFKNAHKINVVLPCNKEVTIGINIRPHLKESLDKIKDVYNIVIFTASHRSYSDAVLNYLDPEDKYFHYRLYRDSCVQYKTNDMNFYVKDLDIFNENYNLKDIIIIDNSLLSFAYHINNGIPVVPFYDSKQDSELPLLSFYLLSISNYKDLREANKEHIKLEYFLSQSKNEISLEEGTIYENKISNDNNNDNNNNNSIINNIKISIGASSKKVNFTRENKNCINNKDIINDNNKEYDIKNDKKEKGSISIGNKSEKKIINGFHVNNKQNERKKFNTVKLESSKILDFFKKWKNAYLQLALKK